MSNKKFFIIFFVVVLATALLHLFIVCIINPQQTSPIALSHKFDNFHDNFLLRKAKLMETYKYETLILGSSTSEAFSVQDVNHYLKTTSFHGSIGGGNTAARFVLFKKALKNFPNLKRVFYVADLYEFNQGKAPSMLAYNDYLASEIEDKSILPGKFDYIKYLFSHQIFESAVTVFKRSKKGYVAPLLNDGSTTISMILSTVQTENQFFAKIHPENKKKLHEEILENNATYSHSVLANFKELDPKVVSLFTTLVKEAKEKHIQVVFVLSPYHADFRKLLLQNEDVKKRYLDWVNFFESLKKEREIIVYNPLASYIATETESGVWRDGIHFNSFAATYFLQAISKGINND